MEQPHSKRRRVPTLREVQQATKSVYDMLGEHEGGLAEEIVNHGIRALLADPAYTVKQAMKAGFVSYCKKTGYRKGQPPSTHANT